MKKKYIAAVLALCMIATSVPATTFAAETTVIDEYSEEKMQELDADDFHNNPTGDADSQSMALDEGKVGITIEQVEEVEGDEAEDAFSSNQVSVYASEDVNADDGYTSLSTADNKICYKYDENEKTLYFKRAAGITELVDMPTTNTGSGSEWVQTIGATNARQITTIKIGDGIKSIGSRNFRADGNSVYANLNKVELAKSVTTINSEAFDKDKKLISINLDNVTSIEMQAFQNNQKLERVAFNVETVNIGEGAFSGCKALTSVTAKNIVLNASSFSSCQKLESFKCESQLENVPERAFYDNWKLADFDFSKVKTIGENAFGGLGAGLTTLNFGEEDIAIGVNAFANCENIANICYPGTSEKWLEISKDSGLPVSSTRSIHCKKDNPTAKAATCEEGGIELETVTCAVCNEPYSVAKEIPALGHKYADDYTVDKEATCTEEGEQSKHCTREGCDSREDIQTIPINKDNHDYVAEITTQPTCAKDGIRTYTCSRCNDTKTEVIPATGEHNWVSEVTTQPTCTKDGVRTDTCSTCGATKTEAIPATGEHVWGDWKKTADATVFAAEQQERACATCDAKETRTVGEKLAATMSVNASSVTLKQEQSTSYVKVSNLANGDSIVSWTSTNPKVFTVSGKADGSCKLTGVKKGSAKLEITLASGLKKTISVKVQTKTVATTKISGLAKKLTVKKGDKTTLQPVLTPFTSGQKLTYTSSNKRVATVSAKGVITAKKAGTAKITVKSGSKKVTVTVTVPKAKTTAVKVSEAVSVKKGKTYNLKTKVTPSNSDEKITYSSSNKKIATVSKSGKIKGIKKGEAVITVKSGKIVKKVKVIVK